MFNIFIHILQTRQGCPEESVEIRPLEAWNSESNLSDFQLKTNTWQMDESKTTEQLTSFCLQQSKTSKLCVPCLADTGNY